MCVGLLLPVLAPGSPTAAAPVTVSNGVQFTDPTGKVVRGHDGGMIKVGEYYYWFGVNPYASNRFRYIAAYRSTDLRTWEFRRHVLTEDSAPTWRISIGPRSSTTRAPGSTCSSCARRTIRRP
ncbi:hypothetical protein [Streptomyces sp. Wb2n-11]|uniref:hypothetical protein n=1 Tax=Streptomyces sp. Wb2n-11 TaxID=1030533 RepID=UPI00350E4920